MKKFFSATPIWADGIVIARVIAGLTILKFGLEIFDADKMNGYEAWLTELGFPAPPLMAKLGKLVELAGGALLVIGLFTRIATLALIITMFVISFIMGTGELISGDSALLLLLLFSCFLFVGPGRLSLDHFIFKSRNHVRK